MTQTWWTGPVSMTVWKAQSCGARAARSRSAGRLAGPVARARGCLAWATRRALVDPFVQVFDTGRMDHAAIQPSPFQRILNLNYPPSAGRVPQRAFIPIEVRLVWAVDGEEWTRTSANGWTSTHVRVLLHDKRTVATVIWVVASDVRRVAPPSTSVQGGKGLGHAGTESRTAPTDVSSSKQGTDIMNSPTHDALTSLSKQKWEWMSAQEIEPLDALFHESAAFVHMGATFTKDQELEVIKSGTIRYRQVDIHDISVRVIGPTGIVLTTLDLHAEVGGNEVTNPFVVTEVYVKDGDAWTLGSMAFTRLVTA